MSLLGIVIALAVLIIICYRKFNPVAGTLVCVIILAIFGGMPIISTITDTYFTGFSEFLKITFCYLQQERYLPPLWKAPARRRHLPK